MIPAKPSDVPSVFQLTQSIAGLRQEVSVMIGLVDVARWARRGYFYTSPVAIKSD